MDLLHATSGLLVGLLVGVTGVGGGSLMAPIMILLLGVVPMTAVGTDLWFAAITKTVGGTVHQKYGKPDWEVVRRLATGSIPASIMTLIVLSRFGGGQIKQGLVVETLGVLLICTGIATMFRKKIHDHAKGLDQVTAGHFKALQPRLTVAAGAILGTMVTLTSVGAGALGATMLLFLYPLRMKASRLVGTDIIHAVPLTVVAGIGHLLMGNVNFALLGSLLVGSIPGIIVGSLISSRIADRFTRPVLAIVLVIVGIKLMN